MKVRDEAFRHYFYFMSERMNIFWKRYNSVENSNSRYTSDPILAKHKFTNVYRCSDRVSQYLIKNVIYSGKYSEEDLLVRILLFKIFNRIDTWQYLESMLGEITYSNFNHEKVSKLLTERIKNQPIFNAAYLMTGSHSIYNSRYISKHEKWLAMLSEEVLRPNKMKLILGSSSLSGLYRELHDCSFIGPFLAYQYSIDLNYSECFDFDENSFVKAGIGAVRGIKKCFVDIDGYSLEDAIRYTQDNLDKYRGEYQFELNNLFGREPTLIDIQNCFCETDKYLRVKMPSLSVGNKRIKQKFNKNSETIDYFFPPKWKLDYQVIGE
ncbi:nucleotide kinase domain-containing protein [Vibrio splendidus]